VHQKSTEDILWRAITSGWTTFLREAFRALEARSETLIASDAFFIAAAHLGDIRLMETLLATGTVNINYQLIYPSGLPQGRNALGEAIRYGGEGTVNWLIQRAGVTKFDFIDSNQNNMYHFALGWQHSQHKLPTHSLPPRPLRFR
jgi:hypothetical protein